jgi:hypothetical protein
MSQGRRRREEKEQTHLSSAFLLYLDSQLTEWCLLTMRLDLSPLAQMPAISRNAFTYDPQIMFFQLCEYASVWPS